MEIDFLIIGQGLAGSAMGYRFVRVFDADSLTKEYLASQGGKNIILARGENICLAQIFRGSF